MRLAFALVCAVMTACYSPGYRDCEVTCTTGACPSGLSCELGYCRVSGATANCSAVLDDGGMDTMGDGGEVAFGTPVALTTDITVLDHDPTLTDNLLELYTSRTAGGAEDIYRYSRTSSASMFTNAVMESSISTAAQSEEGPDVSGDGTTMFFIRDGTSLRDINVATRPSGQPWSGGAPVAELDPGGNTANPSVSRDGLMIVFERLDEVQYSLWQSTRTNLTTSWTSPAPLTSLPINAGFKPHSPTLSTDKLTIYFHGLGPSGKNDIFEAHRSSPTAAFDAPTPVPGINTAAEQEEDPWISADGTTMVFVRSQGNGTQIMMAQRL